MLEASSLSRLRGIRHGFFTREGGVSEGLYASLNCGLGSGDDPERVEENRARAMRQVGVAPGSLAACYQVHSPTAVETDSPWDRDARPRADAIVTTQRGLALGILSADCAPILFADPQAGVIGAAHAGWRGAVSGVIENTLAAMARHGARVERVTAAIGPCIGPSSYEVGPDFPAAFLAEDPGATRFFVPAKRAGHWMFDLPGYVAWRLSRAGVAAVERLPHDTAAEEDRFFSWRRTSLRGEKDYGRLLSAIALAA